MLLIVNTIYYLKKLMLTLDKLLTESRATASFVAGVKHLAECSLFGVRLLTKDALLLEDLLQNFEGTVFLVSHDRTFLDNVVTSTIAYEGDGQWREYEGGVQDWLVQSKRAKEIAAKNATLDAKKALKPSNSLPKLLLNSEHSEQINIFNAPATGANSSTGALKNLTKARKLSFKEQRDLDELPKKIEVLELEQSQVRAKLADGSIYSSDPALALQLTQRDTELDELLLAAMERWESLS
jgi:ATP-binding cassette subfamily F protein uup